MKNKITQLLYALYGGEEVTRVEMHLRAIMETHRASIPTPIDCDLNARDAFLITYADQIQNTTQKPLETLEKFCTRYLRGVVSGVHILPFYPWSSDDGFSVKDYRLVDAQYGDWEDIHRMGGSFRLMFDAVINHCSVQGGWFQAFLRDEQPYRRYFVTVQGSPDLSMVVRPRALPLLTEFQTSTGASNVWTTFSADQVDLDYSNPEVALEIIDILLEYATHGAQFIRLDAIAYLWKEIGTSCIHLPQTHAFVQLLRAVFDETAPHVRLITETNVPHEDNIAYFGNGKNEAQLVYNFALPPLVLHTLQNGDAEQLTRWASELLLPSRQTTFFNFLASHDGIGLNPVRGILKDTHIEALIQKTLDRGGFISYKQNSDGSQSAYEMNINYFDALCNPDEDEKLEMQVGRFIASQAIMLVLQGVPGIYFHSLFGSRGWRAGAVQSGQYRTINRQKLQQEEIELELEDTSSLRARVFTQYRQLLKQRAECSAFDPFGEQRVLDLGRHVFAVLRTTRDGSRRVLCLQNVTAETQQVRERILEPYQSLWLMDGEADVAGFTEVI